MPRSNWRTSSPSHFQLSPSGVSGRRSLAGELVCLLAMEFLHVSCLLCFILTTLHSTCLFVLFCRLSVCRTPGPLAAMLLESMILFYLNLLDSRLFGSEGVQTEGTVCDLGRTVTRESRNVSHSTSWRIQERREFKLHSCPCPSPLSPFSTHSRPSIAATKSQKISSGVPSATRKFPPLLYSATAAARLHALFASTPTLLPRISADADATPECFPFAFKPFLSIPQTCLSRRHQLHSRQ